MDLVQSTHIYHCNYFVFGGNIRTGRHTWNCHCMYAKFPVVGKLPKSLLKSHSIRHIGLAPVPQWLVANESEKTSTLFQMCLDAGPMANRLGEHWAIAVWTIWLWLIISIDRENTNISHFSRNMGKYYTREGTINPFTAKLFNRNFHSLEVVSRWRDPQLQVSENYSELTKWRSIISCCLMSRFISNMFKNWYLMCWFKWK